MVYQARSLERGGLMARGGSGVRPTWRSPEAAGLPRRSFARARAGFPQPGFHRHRLRVRLAPGQHAELAATSHCLDFVATTGEVVPAFEAAAEAGPGLV